MSEITNEQPSFPWLHIGDCPVCGDGLCRIRCCTTSDGGKHLYAVCDECETIWLEPNTSTKRLVPDSMDPKCPLTGQELFSSNSRWATTEDIRGTKWESETIVDLPLTLGSASDIQTSQADSQDGSSLDSPYVTGEDAASALDVPVLTPPAPERQQEGAQPHSDDWAYGQDEPRPGC